jgi:anti-sigma B factor antagonist
MRPMSTDAFYVRGRAGSKEGVHILVPKGAISFQSGPAFREAIEAANAPRLIIDFTEVPSIDSVAVGVLVRAFVSCHKSGRRLALVGLAHRVRNVLQLTGIDPLFEIYPTVADAETALA